MKIFITSTLCLLVSFNLIAGDNVRFKGFSIEAFKNINTPKSEFLNSKNVESNNVLLDQSSIKNPFLGLEIEQSKIGKESLNYFPIICTEIHVSCSDAFTVRCGTIMDLTALWIIAEYAYCGDFPPTID